MPFCITRTIQLSRTDNMMKNPPCSLQVTLMPEMDTVLSW